MLKTIEIAIPDRLPEGLPMGSVRHSPGISPILKRATLVRANLALDMLARARQDADTMREQARDQIQRERNLAIHQGVTAGVHATLAPMLMLLNQLRELKSQLRVAASDQLRHAMQDFLGRAPTLAGIIDAILDEYLPATPSVVRIVVPSSADQDALRTHCQAQDLTVHIVTGDNPDEFSISWEGHQWFADLSQLAERLQPLDPGGDDATLHRHDFVYQCRQALRKLAADPDLLSTTPYPADPVDEGS